MWCFKDQFEVYLVLCVHLFWWGAIGLFLNKLFSFICLSKLRHECEMRNKLK